MRDVVLRRWSVVLLVVAVFFWVIAIALPTWVLVTIGNLPGEDPGRTGRAVAIALGAFLTFALTAAPATIGAALVRQRLRRGDGAARDAYPAERRDRA